MNNAMKLVALSAAIVAGGFGVAEAREGGGKGRGADFETLDTNGDGQITQAEMEARGAARFADADTNSDGALSRDELLARSREGAEKRVDRMLERLDADENGSLSQEELDGARKGRGAGKMFSRVDADGDGAISKEEFDTAMANRKERGGKRHKKRGE